MLLVPAAVLSSRPAGVITAFGIEYRLKLQTISYVNGGHLQLRPRLISLNIRIFSSRCLRLLVSTWGSPYTTIVGR